MRNIYENPEAVDQLADDDLYDDMLRREETDALLHAINGLSDPLLRRILVKIVVLAGKA